MLKATQEQTNAIHTWLKIEMIETGKRRYLDFCVGRQSAHLWAYDFNDYSIAFALIDKGNEIAMFECNGSHDQAIFAARRLLGEIRNDGHSVAIVPKALQAREGFWSALHFEKQSETGRLVLDQRFGHVDEIAVPGRRVPFSIRFFDERYIEKLDLMPFAVTEGIGVLTSIQELIIPKRAVAFGDCLTPAWRTVVEIEVDGKLEIKGHLPSEDFLWIGAKREPSGLLYFDRIDLFTYKHMHSSGTREWLDQMSQ
ncbi:hypothetical protein HFO56_03280 [Rhizobium laguerreae]|uniref:hypothetical protein n=1 Tax=Rhizobium laguerreae TaxID=1076926 RepID=UPI001C91BC19|nr:hypothetical protein [Rhizobium laguerreae]MBY3151410.1 hypothetical protein [Rhizobium laguerreae]